MLEGNGTNDLVQQFLKGESTLDEAVDKAIHAWLSILQQTAGKMTLPRIPGEISIADFQAAFKAVSEKTTSSPLGMHDSIWKVLARDDSIAKWLNIMMSYHVCMTLAVTGEHMR